MKKLLLFLTSLLFVSFIGYSQCTPDGHTTPPYIRPDSATGLPHATVGVPYSTVMQVRVPFDTIAAGNQCDYEYVRIDSLLGLPPGATYSCYPSSCSFPGNSNGCVLISGFTPTSIQAGDTFHLHVVVHYRLYLDGLPLFTCTEASQNLDYYMIVVDPLTGIESLSNSRFDLGQNRPNPFSHSTVIEFSTPVYDVFTLKISNILGKIIYTKNIPALRGINKLTLSGKDFDSGIYFYTLSNSRTAMTKRMIIQNE